MSTTTLASWRAAVLPNSSILQGRFVRLEKLDASKHGDALWTTFTGPDSDLRLWDYLWCGPFDRRQDFDDWLRLRETETDPCAYTVVDQKNNIAEGTLTLMSIIPQHGRIEIGSVVFGAGMQRSPKSTEAVYLLMKEAFALGNRRLEWTCNAKNERSKKAAKRLGFTYEGLLRQFMVVKGENRDNCVFSILDKEWRVIGRSIGEWLRAENFDSEGKQIRTLETFRAENRSDEHVRTYDLPTGDIVL